MEQTSKSAIRNYNERNLPDTSLVTKLRKLKVAPIPERFNKDWFSYKAGERSYVLLVGSSIIQHWKRSEWNSCPVINFGKGGLKSIFLTEYFDYIFTETDKYIEPSYIIFYCGGNDLRKLATTKSVDEHFMEKSIPVVAENITNGIDMLRKQFPKSTIIVLQVMKGERLYQYNMLHEVDEVNEHIRLFVSKKTNMIYVHVNFFLSSKHYSIDGIHINEYGYNLLNNICLIYVYYYEYIKPHMMLIIIIFIYLISDIMKI